FSGAVVSPRGRYRGHGPNVRPLDTADGRGRFATPSPENSMRHVVLPLWIVLATPVAGQAPSATPPPTTVLIKAGRLVDGRGASAQPNMGILIEGDRIKVVGPLAQ